MDASRCKLSNLLLILKWVVEKDNKTYVVPQKLMPKKTHFKQYDDCYDCTRVREIDVFAPLIHGKSESGIKKVNPGYMMPDKLNHKGENVSVYECLFFVVILIEPTTHLASTESSASMHLETKSPSSI